MVEDSIEEKIQQMQEGKKTLLEGAVDQSTASGTEFRKKQEASKRRLGALVVGLFGTLAAPVEDEGRSSAAKRRRAE